MKRQFALAALIVCVSSGAWPQSPDTLPDATNYPDPECKKPQTTLVKPTTSVDNYEAVSTYNAKVKTFNRDAAAYNACMHTFIDKANGDVKRIQDRANADLKQITERANASMKGIQDKIRQAVADAKSVSEALDQETAKLRAK